MLKTACFLFLLCCAPLSAQSPCGDCDGDNFITIVDALLAAQIAVGIEGLGPIDAVFCDVTYPEGVGIIDALRIAQYVVGYVAVLACP